MNCLVSHSLEFDSPLLANQFFTLSSPRIMFNYSNVEHDFVQDEERPKHNIIHFWSLFWIIRIALEFFSFLCSIKIDWFTFEIYYVTCLFAALYEVKIEIIRFTRKVFFSVCSFWSITFLFVDEFESSGALLFIPLFVSPHVCIDNACDSDD